MAELRARSTRLARGGLSSGGAAIEEDDRGIDPRLRSLDTALAALNECCRSNDRAWTAREVFSKLDEVTGTGIFGELYDRHVASKDFPDLAQTWRALGMTGADFRIVSPPAFAARVRDWGERLTLAVTPPG